MKNLSRIAFAIALLALVLGCNPPSSQVCITISNQPTACIADTALVYWLHNESGALRLTSFANLPRDLSHYPQFNQPNTLVNGSYLAVLNSGEISLRAANGTVQMQGLADMGMFFVRTSTGAMAISSSVTGCQTEYLTTNAHGWQLEGDNFPFGITISTTVVQVDADGTNLMTTSLTSHEPGQPDKGTIVVLIDNFKANVRQTCCDASASGCCNPDFNGQDAEGPITELVADGMPTDDSFTPMQLFPIGGTCVSLTCEYLRITDCRTGTVNCYNTALCPTDLWLGNCASGTCTAAGVYTTNCKEPNYHQRCGAETLADGQQ